MTEKADVVFFHDWKKFIGTGGGVGAELGNSGDAALDYEFKKYLVGTERLDDTYLTDVVSGEKRRRVSRNILDVDRIWRVEYQQIFEGMNASEINILSREMGFVELEVTYSDKDGAWGLLLTYSGSYTILRLPGNVKLDKSKEAGMSNAPVENADPEKSRSISGSAR